MYNFDFDNADLQANRAGQLSPHQRDGAVAIQASRQIGAKRTLLAFVIFISVILGISLFSGYGQSTEVDFGTFLQMQLPILGIMAGLFAVMLGPPRSVTFGQPVMFAVSASPSPRDKHTSSTPPAVGRIVIPITNFIYAGTPSAARSSASLRLMLCAIFEKAGTIVSTTSKTIPCQFRFLLKKLTFLK